MNISFIFIDNLEFPQFSSNYAYMQEDLQSSLSSSACLNRRYQNDVDDNSSNMK